MNNKQILLSPIQIGNHKCQNRFFIQPMECNDADQDGNPTELTYKRYENLFRGKAGMVCLEAITITKECRSNINQLSIMPQNVKPLTKFIRHLKEINPETILVVQPTHSGELSSSSFSRCATVKPLQGKAMDTLTEDEIDKAMDGFVLAAQIAHEAGADGIDMKLCHGYLTSAVIRPYNNGNWKYGGSWEKRRQFAFDLYERIQKSVNDKNFLIGSKISVWEGIPGGFGTSGPDAAVIDYTEPVDLVKGLEERGASYFVQTAGHVGESLDIVHVDKKSPYYVYLHHTFAKILRDNLKPETVVIGSGYSAYRNGKNNMGGIPAEQNSLFGMGAYNIANGVNDMIGLGRQSFADPLLPLKYTEGREEEIKYCTLCNKCEELIAGSKTTGCCIYNKYYTDLLVQMQKEKSK